MTRRSPPIPRRSAAAALSAAGLIVLLGAAAPAPGGGDQDEPKPQAKPKILVAYSPPFMQFGFRLVGKKGKPAAITFAPPDGNPPAGQTNILMVRIDGMDYIFGDTKKGKWSPKQGPLGGGKVGQKSVWVCQGVSVTQAVEIVKSKTGMPDTALITYQLENKGEEARKVGLRLLLDTYVGENDGTPFAVVGKKKLIEDQADFKGKNVPEAVQVMEKADLDEPGVVAYFTLKPGGKVQGPDRFSITHWQQDKLASWDVPVQDIDGDSAVVLYWNAQDLEAGGSRTVGFGYGGGVLSGAGAKKKAADDEK
jgi:hypothetical protein